MRVTVDLDEGLVRTAKELARLRHQSIGRVISDLAEQGLTPGPIRPVETRNGVPILPRKPGAKPVTDEHVRELLELED